jgi:hypothetical protein
LPASGKEEKSLSPVPLPLLPPPPLPGTKTEPEEAAMSREKKSLLADTVAPLPSAAALPSREIQIL